MTITTNGGTTYSRVSPTGLATAALSGVVFVATVTAFVVLELNNRPTDGLVALAGPVVGSLFAVGALSQAIHARTAPLAAGVEEVRRQTNGVMDARIRTQVSAALAEVLPTAVQAVQAQAPPAPAPATPAPAGEVPSTATLPASLLPSRT